MMSALTAALQLFGVVVPPPPPYLAEACMQLASSVNKAMC